MSSLDEIRNARLAKLEALKSRGMDPYPSETDRDHSIEEVLDDFNSLERGNKEVTVAGRVMALRKHGGVLFSDLYDGTGTLQGFFKADEIGGEEFSFLEDVIDVGDFIEVKGRAFTTKAGEKSVLAGKWKMLSKSLRPLPEKWHGLQDQEERFRHRYLDILFNKDVKEMVERRAKFWNSIRGFMMDNGFLEVQTPALEATAGGADARPFETHHNAFDMNLYLRISAGELWQKELLVSGFTKIFELGRIFRNEGVSNEHFQDYTQMEFYWAYADYKDGMDITEKLFKHIAQETWGTLEFEVNGHKVDLGSEWERFDYRDTVKKFTGVDPLEATLEEVEGKLKELNIKYDKSGNLPRAMDALWKHCRKQISGPGFLVGVPKSLSPLAKSSADNPEITERFQTIIGGTELSNGFSELNNPIDQRERFEIQQKMREAGDDEAQMMNEDFLEAMEYGMPPACGFGMSERVFSVLSGLSAREAQIFPLMRPRE